MEKITYLSYNVQYCFNELFFIFYEKNTDFINSVVAISSYLISDSNEYYDVI